MITHLAMNSHPSPRNVLVIGGGDGGVLREVVKHPCVEKATLCDIDEAVIRLSKKYLPGMSIGFQHPNVQVHVGDGFEYLRERTNEFDVIITDSSDPEGPAESLFQKPYFELLFGALKEGGVITTQGCLSYSLCSILLLLTFVFLFLLPQEQQLIILFLVFLQPKTNGSTSHSSPSFASPASKSSLWPSTPTPQFPPIHPAKSASWSAARMPSATCAYRYVRGLTRRRKSCVATTIEKSTKLPLCCPTLPARRFDEAERTMATRWRWKDCSSCRAFFLDLQEFPRVVMAFVAHDRDAHRRRSAQG